MSELYDPKKVEDVDELTEKELDEEFEVEPDDKVPFEKETEPAKNPFNPLPVKPPVKK